MESIFDSAKEEGELSDDEEDIIYEGIYRHDRNTTKLHNVAPRTRPKPQSLAKSTTPQRPSRQIDTNHHEHPDRTHRPFDINTHKDAPHYHTQAYSSYDTRKRGRTRHAPPKRSLQSSSQENKPANLKPAPATNSCRTSTSMHVQPSVTSHLSSRENVVVPSLLTLEIPVPPSLFLHPAIPPPPPPPPPPLPLAPPPDKPEPPPLSLPAAPRERARKQRKGVTNNAPVQNRMKSPPAGDVEDPDYIDLLLEYQCIKKQLDKLSKAEESERKKSAIPHHNGAGQGHGTAVQTTEIHNQAGQERADEDLDILQLRLNALKSVGSDSPVNSPVKSNNRDVATIRGSPTKRSLPFAPRDLKFHATSDSAKRRRRNNSAVRDGTAKSYRSTPRRGRDLSWRDEALVRRWSQERRKEQADKRRRDEDKRRAEQHRLEEEYESNRRRLEVQKIVTLDDPKEQYKRFMELVAGVEKVTRSEVADPKPIALADNYEEVAMELDSDDTVSTDDKVAMTTDVFNLPKLAPDVIPGLDLSISSNMYEPAFTADLVAFSSAANAFRVSFDSPSFANLYVSPPKGSQSPIHMAGLPSTESDLPDSSEEIPGLGWSNEPSKPKTPEETAARPKTPEEGQVIESIDVSPENENNSQQQEEDEEALLRAKLLKSLLMRKKLQAETASSAEPQTNNSSRVQAVCLSGDVTKRSDHVVRQLPSPRHAPDQRTSPGKRTRPDQRTSPETILQDKKMSVCVRPCGPERRPNRPEGESCVRLCGPERGPSRPEEEPCVRPCGPEKGPSRPEEEPCVRLCSPERGPSRPEEEPCVRPCGSERGPSRPEEEPCVPKSRKKSGSIARPMSNTDVVMDATGREPADDSEAKVYRKVPRHGPVVIRIGDESEESEDEGVAPGPSEARNLQGSGHGRVEALLGNLDSFIKEARLSVEANVKPVQENENKDVDVDDDDKPNSEMETPEVMKNMPRTKIAEYKKLKEQLLRVKQTGSSSKLSKVESTSEELQEDPLDKLGRQKEELQKELRQRVVLLQLELVQQRHSLRVNNDTYSSLKHETTKKRAVLKMGEDHIQKLREQLAAAERIVQSNRNQLNILNEQAQDSQALVDEKMARVQALEAQLVSVGRQAYGDTFTQKMANQALMMDPLGQGKKRLTVTVNKNQVAGRQVKLPVPTSMPDKGSTVSPAERGSTVSPARKVVVVKKKPVLSKPAAARKVKLHMKTAKMPKRIPNVTKPPTRILRTSQDISTEKARLMKLEQKLAAMIQKHKAVQSKSASNSSKATKPVTAPELPSPVSNVWKSIRRRSGSHVRRDSEPEHIHTEELMKVDREENMDHTNEDRSNSLLDTSHNTKPSLSSNHSNSKSLQAECDKGGQYDSVPGQAECDTGGQGDRIPVQGQCDKGGQGHSIPAQGQCDKGSQGDSISAHGTCTVHQAIYKINSSNDYNKVLKAYRSALQQRFKESLMVVGRCPADVLLPPLTQLPAPSQATQDTSEKTTAESLDACYASSLLEAGGEECTSSLRDYHSSLLHFRGYRLSPYFRTKEKLSLVSSSYSHKVNPYKAFCPYELMGKCNDDKCVGQHSSHYKLGHDELLKDYLTYHSPMITDDKARLLEEMNTFVEQFTKTHNSKFTIDQQCLLLVAKVNKLSERAVPHTMVTDGRPWRPRQKAEKDLPAEELSGFKSATQRVPNHDDTILTDKDLRYWGSGATNVTDMEAAVLATPTNVDMWLTLAYHKLHNMPGRREDCLDLALNVLARSLESNSKNSFLWLHYLGVYSQRSDAADIESLYKQGLSYAPSYQLYWKYLTWCRTLRDKFDVCHQIMKFLLSELCTETPGEKSHHLLEILIHQVALYVNIGLEQEALQLIQCAMEIPSTGLAPEPWHILTTRDRLLLMLTHVHLELFHGVPHQLYDPAGTYPGRILNKLVFSLPWTQLFQGLNVNDPVSAPKVFKLCKDAHTILEYWITQIHTAMELASEHNEESLGNLSVLRNNMADMYLAAGRPRSAQTSCVEALGSDARDKDTYIKLIECAARNKDERSAGARCWYKQAITHLPTCAKIYLTAADYELQQGDDDAALELMEQCALAMFVTDSAHATSCDPNLLLCKLLDQSVPLTFDAPPLRPSVTPANITAQRADLWNCYCLLLELQGCLDQALEVYGTAILTLRGTDALTDVWKRYLRHKHKAVLSLDVTQQGEAFKQLSSLVTKCIRTLPNRASVPHTSLTWPCYRSQNVLLELYIPAVPAELMVDVYEGLVRAMPDNIPLVLRALNYMQKNGHVALAKGYCVAALTNFPHCLSLWNIHISLLQKENNVTEMRRAYKQATDALPLNANLWKDFAQFELIQGSEERLKEVLDLSKDPDLHLEDWIETWTGSKVKVTAGKKHTGLTSNSKRVKGKVSGTIQKSPKMIQKSSKTIQRVLRTRIEGPAKPIGVIQSDVDRKSKDQPKNIRKVRK